jgi:hypothetical protein
MLRKLWQVTRDPAYRTAVSWVTRTITRMTRRKAMERWETKVRNCDVTPQALRLIAKSLMKMDGPKAPTAIHGHLVQCSTVLPERESQRDCGLFRQPVHIS